MKSSSLGLPLLIGAMALPAFADSDEYSAMAHLESSTPVVGGSTTFRVRSPRIGAPVVVAADLALAHTALGPGRPLLALTPGLAIVGSGAIDASGTFEVTIPTPRVGTLYAQAVLVAGETYVSNYLRLRPGTTSQATFSDATSLGLDPDAALYSATDVDWADVNQDGCPDAIVANDGEGALPLILIGDCALNLTNEAALRLPALALRPTSCVEVDDVNNDSWPDLFLGGGTNAGLPAANLLLLNDGAGGFYLPAVDGQGSVSLLGADSIGGGVRPFGFPDGKGRAVDAEFGDVDGDGDLDLVVASVADADHPGEVPDPVTLYVNRGGIQGGTLGVFRADASFATIGSSAAHANGADASFGDLDADGDLDLFLCGADSAAGGTQARVLVNDGSGAFTDVAESALPRELDNAFEADLGDFDGDGDLDVLVAVSLGTSNPTGIHLYENRTTRADAPVFVDGSVRLPASLGGTTGVRLSLDVGDVDDDGDLDAVVGIHELPSGPGVTDGEAVLLVNQGGAQGGVTGAFAVDASFLPGLFVDADVALGDVDFDGDLDLYIANSGNLFQFDFHDELWLNEL